ncbi:MAG: 3-hydroxyacyl-CoA dehydrogenase/enoyl-CoA hydratase family protein [Deltaproteobacteria bacterium]|nr:MAG: 3-hydroxyacyl-CoA dehydrogenase/enoyl-CoA hydratase family protein [Deltaproteobacteria bacterium]
MKELKQVTVLGAGAMGGGLALLCSESGFDVKVRDIEEEYLEKGRNTIENQLDRRIKRGKFTEEGKNNVLGRIQFTTDLKEAVKDADYIIEAVTEEMDIKQKLFKEVHQYAPKHAIFGSNTSSFVISEIAAAIPEPERVIGIHFFNPPSAMKLLEIIYGEKTSEETIKVTDEFAKLLGREVIYCLKDSPGFVTTRLITIMISESGWAVDLDGANIPEVDAALKYRLGLPMGMFEFSDVLGGGGGVALQHKVTRYLSSKLGETYRNAPIMEKKYESGEWGVTSGKGFYDWSEGKKNEIPFKLASNFDPIRILAPLANEAVKLVENGIMTKEDLDKALILGLGFPRGLLRMADSIGLDKIVTKVNELFDTHKEERYRCSPMLASLVKKGNLGRKTGDGIYSYGPGEYEFITLDFDKKKGIAKLTINRPLRANALNVDCFSEINKALDAFEASDEVKCLVITGAGRVFCAGADISMFGARDVTELLNMSTPVQELLTRLETLNKPVIAAINGACLGGGLELAIACDLRIAKEGAILGFPEANLGIFPGAGGTQRVTRLIGLARAKELVLMAQNITAQKALDWGLVNAVAEPDKFESTVEEMAQTLADKASLAQGIAKRVMYYGAQADQRTALFLEGFSSPPAILSDDASEGITAFMYRRKPNFGAKNEK